MRFLATGSLPSIIANTGSISNVARSAIIAVTLARFDALVVILYETEIASAVSGRYTRSIIAILAVGFADASIASFVGDEAVVALAELRFNAGTIVARVAKGFADPFDLLVSFVTRAMIGCAAKPVIALLFADRLAYARIVFHRAIIF